MVSDPACVANAAASFPTAAVIAAASGLLGAVVGGGASLLGTKLAQDATDKRAKGEAADRQLRVQALFESASQEIAAWLNFQVNVSSPVVMAASVFSEAIAPLVRLSEDKALVLELPPSAILALAKSLRTASDDIEMLRSLLELKDRKDNSVERIDEVGASRAILRQASNEFKDLLSALGVSEITYKPMLLQELPEYSDSETVTQRPEPDSAPPIQE